MTNTNNTAPAPDIDDLATYVDALEDLDTMLLEFSSPLPRAQSGFAARIHLSCLTIRQLILQQLRAIAKNIDENNIDNLHKPAV